MADSKEPGQRAYEAHVRAMQGQSAKPNFDLCDERGKAAWAAAEQACAVPEVADVPRCPSCGSPEPRLHPAIQHEGECRICRDPYHGAPEAAEGGKAQAEWTACRHGCMLPPTGEKVMFWCRGWLAGATPGVGTFHGDFWEDETQTENCGDAFKLIPSSEVTHWMPLPSPPKGDR